MIKVTVQKNYIGLEDLLIGLGTVTQQRGPTGTNVTITKINGANLPYDADYSMQEKFDALEALIDTLPVVVDEDGNLLTGLINTSFQNLNLAGRLWRKEISSTEARIYYGTELLFSYNPTTGGIVLPDDTDYIAADTLIVTAYQLADANIITAYQAADAAIVASLGTAAEKDVGILAGQVVMLETGAKLPAVDGSQLLNTGVPLGTTVAVPYSTVPAGWALCDGQALNRTTYAALFALIGTTFGAGDGSTTFTLPDLRGEFIRGLDQGRNVDTGRTLGSNQSDMFKAHTHEETKYSFQTGDQNGGIGIRFASEISAVTTSSGGTETRPRNVAMNYIIKIS